MWSPPASQIEGTFHVYKAYKENSRNKEGTFELMMKSLKLIIEKVRSSKRSIVTESFLLNLSYKNHNMYVSLD